MARLTRTALLLGLLLAAPAVAATAPPAAAHSYVVETSPASGTSVAGVSEVTITFNEAVDPQVVDVVVTGADGADHVSGPPGVSGPLVVQPVSGLPAGEVVVGYRVVSVDGHPVSGDFSFAVQESATPTPTPSPTATPASSPSPSAAATDGPSSVPVLVSIATIPVMLVILGLLIRRVMRESTPPPVPGAGGPDDRGPDADGPDHGGPETGGPDADGPDDGEPRGTGDRTPGS